MNRDVTNHYFDHVCNDSVRKEQEKSDRSYLKSETRKLNWFYLLCTKTKQMRENIANEWEISFQNSRLFNLLALSLSDCLPRSVIRWQPVRSIISSERQLWPINERSVSVSFSHPHKSSDFKFGRWWNPKRKSRLVNWTHWRSFNDLRCRNWLIERKYSRKSGCRINMDSVWSECSSLSKLKSFKRSLTHEEER